VAAGEALLGDAEKISCCNHWWKTPSQYHVPRRISCKNQLGRWWTYSHLTWKKRDGDPQDYSSSAGLRFMICLRVEFIHPKIQSLIICTLPHSNASSRSAKGGLSPARKAAVRLKVALVSRRHCNATEVMLPYLSFRRATVLCIYIH
jgi:hypothetical protein